MIKTVFYHNKELIKKLPPEGVLVFGSNSRGVHGAGAAKDAHRFFGAKYGQAFGLQGQSYAIPTRTYLERKQNNSMFENMPLKQIKQNVDLFFADAAKMPDRVFVITRLGCGLAGYSDEQIAPMFSKPLSNTVLPRQWLEFIDYQEAIQLVF